MSSCRLRTKISKPPEELQSLNEELTTVNEELRQANLELTELNADLGNLLRNRRTVLLAIE
jgi:hypothetical protein